MVLEKNIIKKLNVEIETSSINDAFYIKDHIDTYFRDEIYPEVEAILEKLQIESGDDILRFDTIPLEIYMSSKDSLNDIKPLLLSKLNNVLNIKKNKKSNIKRTSFKSKENKVNAFLFYLEKGRSPWWFTSGDIFDSEALNHISNNSLFMSKLAPLLTNNNVRKRLIYHLEDEAIFDVILAINKTSKSSQNIALQLTLNNTIRLDFWNTILAQITHGKTSKFIQELEVLIRRISGHSNTSTKHFEISLKTLKKQVLPLINLSNTLSTTKVSIQYNKENRFHLQLSEGKSIQQLNVQNLDTIKAIEKEQIKFNSSNEIIEEPVADLIYPQSQQNIEDLIEGILVQNAGLVLLHPFLKQLFGSLGFLLEDKKIKGSRLSEALGALHYLATKQEMPNETELVCEKFLCNIPIEQAISPVKKLSRKQKDSCDEMLEAVLSHWTALKTKNIDVLRSEFLMREGKISVTAKKEKVFIQRKTQDILLEKLPWNLSLMKLPWKENMIILEW